MVRKAMINVNAKDLAPGATGTWEKLIANPTLWAFWQAVSKDEPLTFQPAGYALVHADMPVFKRTNAELRAWVRKNFRGRYARRELNGNWRVIFFSKEEDAAVFRLTWV